MLESNDLDHQPRLATNFCKLLPQRPQYDAKHKNEHTLRKQSGIPLPLLGHLHMKNRVNARRRREGGRYCHFLARWTSSCPPLYWLEPNLPRIFTGFEAEMKHRKCLRRRANTSLGGAIARSITRLPLSHNTVDVKSAKT